MQIQTVSIDIHHNLYKDGKKPQVADFLMYYDSVIVLEINFTMQELNK